MELLRLAVTAGRVDVLLGTLRLWVSEGRVAVVWVGRERRAASAERREARRRLLADAGEQIGEPASGTGRGGPGRFPAAGAGGVWVGDGCG